MLKERRQTTSVVSPKSSSKSSPPVKTSRHTRNSPQQQPLNLNPDFSPSSDQPTACKKSKTVPILENLLQSDLSTTNNNKTSSTKLSSPTRKSIPEPDTIEPPSPLSRSFENHSVIELPEFLSHLITLDLLFRLPRSKDNTATLHAARHLQKLDCYLFDDDCSTELTHLRNIHHC